VLRSIPAGMVSSIEYNAGENRIVRTESHSASAEPRAATIVLNPTQKIAYALRDWDQRERSPSDVVTISARTALSLCA
jgi:hypothetical protein